KALSMNKRLKSIAGLIRAVEYARHHHIAPSCFGFIERPVGDLQKVIEQALRRLPMGGKDRGEAHARTHSARQGTRMGNVEMCQRFKEPARLCLRMFAVKAWKQHGEFF